MVSDLPGAASLSSSRVTTTYSPPPSGNPLTMSWLPTSSPVTSSTFLYRIRCEVSLRSWLKWIVWSAVAGYSPTGTFTSPKLRNPDQMDRAMLSPRLSRVVDLDSMLRPYGDLGLPTRQAWQGPGRPGGGTWELPDNQAPPGP